MELRKFVTETLAQLIAGVEDAQKDERATTALVVPIAFKVGKDTVRPRADTRITQVDFDVAITVEETSKKGGEGGLKVMGLGISGEKRTEAIQSSVSRVKFQIPVILPGQEEKD